jgi:hypothetical protein
MEYGVSDSALAKTAMPKGRTLTMEHIAEYVKVRKNA